MASRTTPSPGRAGGTTAFTASLCRDEVGFVPSSLVRYGVVAVAVL
jgi:hypothetical protein